MNSRVFIIGLLTAACLAEIFGILVQHGQGNQLREEQQQYLSRLAASSTGDLTPAPIEQSTPVKSSVADTAVPPELLRLRSEATRLARRKRELAGVAAEGERLRAELAARPMNATTAAGTVAPPGFIRKSEARNMGAGAPEDTVQTLLWAVQNRDITNVLALFTPEAAQELQARNGNKSDFFQGAEGLVGLSVLGRQQLAPDLIELSLSPNGDPSAQPFRFRLIEGQWKLEKLP